MSEQIKRQVAKKVSIRDLISGEYVKQEGWEPNYILTNSKEKISRVNLIGVIIDKEDQFNTIAIDDSSGNIKIKSFEDDVNFDKFNLGDIVIIIGKPREFNNEKMIIPEIIKKLKDPLWVKVRKKELGLNDSHNKIETKTSHDFEEEIFDNKGSEEKDIEEINISPKKEIIEETIDSNENQEEDDEPISDAEKIIQMIKKLDKGDGVDIEDIISKSKIDNCEELINKMILIGEIFEIKPGIVKVLE